MVQWAGHRVPGQGPRRCPAASRQGQRRGAALAHPCPPPPCSRAKGGRRDGGPEDAPTATSNRKRRRGPAGRPGVRGRLQGARGPEQSPLQLLRAAVLRDSASVASGTKMPPHPEATLSPGTALLHTLARRLSLWTSQVHI